MLLGMRFKQEYKSPVDNVVEDFLIPALSEAKSYDRAVGYFSSTSLVVLTRGISKMIQNGGKIRIVCSPELSEEDIIAIKTGLKNRKDVIKNYLSHYEIKTDDYFEQERLNMLAHMIEDNQLEIKIALTIDESETSIFHTKIGIISDGIYFVAFSGSMNESLNGLMKNPEHIDVFTNFDDYSRAISKKNMFEEFWNNEDPTVEVIDFPDDLKKQITKYKKPRINWNIDKEQFKMPEKKYPKLPAYIKELRPYQEKAIVNWKNNNYVGIYDMCTGAGKTIAALQSAVTLLEDKNHKMGIVILCPYQHLVDQWCRDLDGFGFRYVIGYSTSPQRDWKNRLKQAVFDYNNMLTDYFCLITTNDSFASKFVTEQLDNVERDMLIIADEAHNLGTNRLLNKLDNRFKYRLALSATIDRHNDAFGTASLYNYFGEKCIIYTLRQAIYEDKKLTPYHYHPIPVYLNEQELEKYNELSDIIQKYIRKEKDGTITYDKKAEIYLIKRARIVAGCDQKIEKLIETIRDYKLENENHMLVYCGATTAVDCDYQEKHPLSEEITQLQKVELNLHNKLGMNVSKFTSEESAEKRMSIARAFDEGIDIKAMVAIRCLDEGVDIPSIKTVFILASSTNPKEYIQRRGRVLRKFEGKDYAEIFDYITLPRELNKIDKYMDTDRDLGLICRELKRAYDFGKLSENLIDTEELINDIEMAYSFIFERSADNE